LAKLSAEYKNELDNLSAEHKNELDKLSTEHEDKLAKLSAEHKNELDKLAVKHAQTSELLLSEKTEHEKTKQQHEKDNKDLLDKFQQEKLALMNMHSEEKKNLIDAHENKLAELSDKYKQIEELLEREKNENAKIKEIYGRKETAQNIKFAELSKKYDQIKLLLDTEREEHLKIVKQNDEKNNMLKEMYETQINDIKKMLNKINEYKGVFTTENSPSEVSNIEGNTSGESTTEKEPHESTNGKSKNNVRTPREKYITQQKGPHKVQRALKKGSKNVAASEIAGNTLVVNRDEILELQKLIQDVSKNVKSNNNKEVLTAIKKLETQNKTLLDHANEYARDNNAIVSEKTPRD
jgi:uncharacterized pyridoxamine 5'-phosphate oxidase family protein